MSRRVVFRIPASTTNFGPGFDTLGAALSIENVVEAEVAGAGRTLLLKGRDADQFGSDMEEMVNETLEEAFGERVASLPGLKITFHNATPIARGLGSSAAVRLGVMAAIGELLEHPLSIAELLKMGRRMEGHPDNAVPAAVGGFTACAVIGDEIAYARTEVDAGLKFVAAVPGFATYTDDARQVLPRELSRQDAVSNLNRSALMVMLMTQGKYADLGPVFADRLHQPFREKLVPGLFKVIRAATDAGAVGGFLSGSGSTVMAVTLDDPDRVAAAMVEAFEKAGSAAETMVLTVDNEGLERLE